MTALALVLALAAQEAAKPPAQEAAAKKEELEAVVVQLKGTVDVKRPEDKDWVPAERNMKLKKGSEICTAVASGATLLLTGNVKVDVKALTQAKIEDLAKQGAKMNADVKLKFGTLEVEIQKGDLRADMKIAAPNSTTSVSGSHGIIRAFASAGGGDALISLRTFSGTWTFEGLDGLRSEIEGLGLVDDRGRLTRDLWFRFTADLFLDYLGRSEGELGEDGTSVQTVILAPGDVPLYEFGGTGPASKKHLKPSALPLPPPPPPQP